MKNVLMVAAEVAPFVTVGGLSQVMYFLPRALKKRGLDVQIFTAQYGVTNLFQDTDSPPKLQPDIVSLPVPTGDHDAVLECSVISLTPQRGDDAIVHFLQNREYFELRANVFGYGDDPTRFALLCKGALEWLKHQHELREQDEDVWWPDAIHCHDWHAAYFIEMARRDPRYRDLLKSVPITLSIHNLKYQGVRDFRFLKEEERDDTEQPLRPLTDPKLANQNALRRGIIWADAITTVSPTHAIEILTPEYSEGLLDVLTANRSKITGILNGLDWEDFNPETDTVIRRRYSKRNFVKARRENKLHLQREFSLPENTAAPVLGFVGRLTPQKGIDLILETMPQLLRERPEVQLIIVGPGEEKYRQGLTELQQNFPRSVGLYLHSDFRLPRKLFGGADVMLMPSLFEPGGIVAIESLRFGAVPLVRRTGGLRDSVQSFDPEEETGNGFGFETKNAWSLYGAIVEALTVYRQPKLWEQLVENALDTSVTWDDAAAEYERWYENVTAERERALDKRYVRRQSPLCRLRNSLRRR